MTDKEFTPMVNVNPFELSGAFHGSTPLKEGKKISLDIISQEENEENVPSFTIEIMPLTDPLSNENNTKVEKVSKAPQRVLQNSVNRIPSLGHSSDVKTLQRKNYFKEEKLLLECEWDDCIESFENVEVFVSHVAGHVLEVDVVQQEEPLQDVFACLWGECGFESPNSTEMVRHVHFHSFHTKIKCHGLNILTSHGLTPCSLDPTQRNVLPDMSEPFQCEWDGCEHKNEMVQPQVFYRHVTGHAEERRGSKVVLCGWINCTKAECGSVSKLKEHLRSHSQERLVGCPTCGGLFANRVKYFDHCKRQQVTKEQSFTCNNCGKRFALERLLRDHMRSHINHYKCPQCDMTCPTPSALANHIRYKHVTEKIFSCEFCDFRGKRQADIKGHIRVHFQEEDIKCQEEGCEFKCRAQSTMKNHFLKKHTNSGNLYACHLCDKRYGRGSYLTKHLIKIHNFTWPSGHSRFRYNRDETTGLYRLQTIRFESLDLQEELQGGAGSLRISDNEEEVDSVRSDTPSEEPGMQFRTSSPIPTSSIYSGGDSVRSWATSQGTGHSTESYYSSTGQRSSYRSLRSGQEGEDDDKFSFLSSHEDSYRVKYPLDQI